MDQLMFDVIPEAEEAVAEDKINPDLYKFVYSAAVTEYTEYRQRVFAFVERVDHIQDDLRASFAIGVMPGFQQAEFEQWWPEARASLLAL